VGFVEEDGAHRGEFHVSAGAVEEPGSEGVLQLADLDAEGRLGDVEPECRSTEMQLLSDGNEVPQHPQLRHLRHAWTLTRQARRHQ
jgi:hypothetical protein